MRKKANLLMSNLIGIILVVIFTGILFLFISQKQNSASEWEDFYVKEIARMIEMSKPGDELNIDVHKITEVAYSNRLKDFNSIFTFDNDLGKICVRLSKSEKRSCYDYFNDVDIVDVKVTLLNPVNMLSFKVVKNE
jgi:hypothetical protein